MQRLQRRLKRRAEAAKHEQSPAAAPERKVSAPGGIYEFHSDKWGELYAKRIDEMIAALKSKGVPVLWVGLPAIRGARSTSDMSYLDELYRAGAEKSGSTYVDVWDGFTDDKGNFAVQGPDFEGQTCRLRTFDGVNFTKAGAEKLAHYVEHELRRVMSTTSSPWLCLVLKSSRKATPDPRSARSYRSPPTGGGEGGDLLGAGNRAAERETDPVAARGAEPWRGACGAARPRRRFFLAADHATAAPEITPSAPVEVSPPPTPKPAVKNDTGKNDLGKNDLGKNGLGKNGLGKTEPNKNNIRRPANARTQAAPTVAPPTVRPGQPRAALDGAPPRPPLPLRPDPRLDFR